MLPCLTMDSSSPAVLAQSVSVSGGSAMQTCTIAPLLYTKSCHEVEWHRRLSDAAYIKVQDASQDACMQDYTRQSNR